MSEDQLDLGFDLCPFCRTNPATLLCDFVIGYKVPGRDEIFTCDRLICEDCATVSSTIFIDGPKLRRVEHRHLCPQCKGVPDRGIIQITKAEAERQRATMWKRSVGILKAI
jgi:hypothetical protein